MHMYGQYSQVCPVLFGSGTVKEIGTKVKEFGITKVMLITDKGIVRVGHDKKILESLAAAHISVTVFDESAADAPDTVIQKAADIFKSERCDGLIGLGGGSSLDTAKGVAVAAANSDLSVRDLLTGTRPANPPKKLILVPTTAGTGSESTFIAVITNTETHVKSGIFCFPTFSIVDPALTLGTPENITAACALDAFSHAVEALTSRTPNPQSDILALEAIRQIIAWLPAAYRNIQDLEAREHLAIASNFAGKAFNDTRVHLGHVIAHAMGATYHISHGVACALVTPVIIEIAAKTVPHIIAEIAEAMGVFPVPADADIGKAVAEADRALMRQVHIPSLEAMGKTYEDIAALKPYCMAEMRMASSAVFDVTEKVIENALRDMFELYK